MPQDLTDDERQLAQAAALDPAVLAALREHTEFEFLPIQGDPAATTPGVSISVAHGSAAEALITAAGPALAALGYLAFWSERREPNGLKETDEVMVLKTDDPYAAVRLRATDGANYGVSTSDIIDRLQSWRALCTFRVVGAARDWVALQFETLPENVCAFAEDVYLFCPDTVDQGVGLMREDEHRETFARARTLCPHVSERVAQATNAKLPALGGMDPAVAEQFRKLLGSTGGFSTPVDMGVRLLADDVRSTRYLHLWWD